MTFTPNWPRIRRVWCYVIIYHLANRICVKYSLNRMKLLVLHMGYTNDRGCHCVISYCVQQRRKITRLTCAMKYKSQSENIDRFFNIQTSCNRYTGGGGGEAEPLEATAAGKHGSWVSTRQTNVRAKRLNFSLFARSFLARALRSVF